MRTIFFAAIMAMASSALAAAHQQGPSGRYCGSLLSGGAIVDAETSLHVDADGRISGDYLFRDQGRITSGQLREADNGSGQTRMLNWTDRYGRGWLVVRFDSRFDRFEGRWGMDDSVPSQVWSGERCQEPNS